MMSTRSGNRPALVARLLGWLAGMTMLVGFFVLVGWQASPNVSADDEAPGTSKAALPPELEVVPREAVGFLSVRVADLWQSQAVQNGRRQAAKRDPALWQDVQSSFLQSFERLVAVPPAEVERLTIVGLDGTLRGEMPCLLVTTVKPYARAKVLQTVTPGGQENQYQRKIYYTGVSLRSPALHFLNDRTFLFGPPKAVQVFLEKAEARDGEDALSDALRTAAQMHHVVAGVNPQAVKEAGQNLLQDTPPLVVLLFSTHPLLQARATSLILDLGDESRLDLRLSFSRPEVAKASEDSVQAGLMLARKYLARLIREVSAESEGSSALLQLLKQSETALKTAKIEQQDSVVHASLMVKSDLALALAEAVARVGLEAERVRSANNLHQIALALHQYESTYGRFPPAAVSSKAGKPLYSWRVAILPFIEEMNLYRQFKLDEPWDSPNNKKLLAQMPKIYGPLRGQNKESYSTFYQVFVGPTALFENRLGPRIAEIVDGTSNTLMVVEAGEAVPWTKPVDLSYSPDKPLPKLGGLYLGGFHAAFADGSVHFLKKGLDEETLRALITRNGGEVVTIPPGMDSNPWPDRGPRAGLMMEKMEMMKGMGKAPFMKMGKMGMGGGGAPPFILKRAIPAPPGQPMPKDAPPRKDADKGKE